jgi:hypothetical protein
MAMAKAVEKVALEITKATNVKLQADKERLKEEVATAQSGSLTLTLNHLPHPVELLPRTNLDVTGHNVDASGSGIEAHADTIASPNIPVMHTSTKSREDTAYTDLVADRMASIRILCMDKAVVGTEAASTAANICFLKASTAANICFLNASTATASPPSVVVSRFWMGCTEIEAIEASHSCRFIGTITWPYTSAAKWHRVIDGGMQGISAIPYLVWWTRLER